MVLHISDSVIVPKAKVFAQYKERELTLAFHPDHALKHTDELASAQRMLGRSGDPTTLANEVREQHLLLAMNDVVQSWPNFVSLEKSSVFPLVSECKEGVSLVDICKTFSCWPLYATPSPPTNRSSIVSVRLRGRCTKRPSFG